ncbi:Voltage-gated Ion Channel (VIC) Superfamily [Phytophthora palmivora]|uniref:Voltage-gated Ion Channel (VIC) Superfamily n=1 Tax=Phytophthora palmivora TaxID=4796 RepID=A0A2P4YP76_9STRA|nr:Voltage-gated Ion Channel (VIC) Superfamily [Phytophthora palmivora]
MPLYAAISPTFSTQEESLDALVNSTFYAESMIKGTGAGATKHTTTLGRFEKIFRSETFKHLYEVWRTLSVVSRSSANCKMIMKIFNTLTPCRSLNFANIFTPELLIRLIIWPSLWREHEYLTERRLKPFLRDFFNWFDVAAIVPFYTDLIFGKEKSFLQNLQAQLAALPSHPDLGSPPPTALARLLFNQDQELIAARQRDQNQDQSLLEVRQRLKDRDQDLSKAQQFFEATVATIGYGDITPPQGNVASR